MKNTDIAWIMLFSVGVLYVIIGFRIDGLLSVGYKVASVVVFLLAGYFLGCSIAEHKHE